MGHGVAQIIAQAGYQVLALETNQEAITKGMKRFGLTISIFVRLIACHVSPNFTVYFRRIENSLTKIVSKDVQKGKYSEVCRR